MSTAADQVIEELEASPASLITGEDLDDAFDETKMSGFFDQAVEGTAVEGTAAEALVAAEATANIDEPADIVAPSVEITEKAAAAQPDQLAAMQVEIDRLNKEANDAKAEKVAAELKVETEAALGEAPVEYVDPMAALSEEVKDSLTQYSKDWPEISAAEKVHRDVMAQRMGTIIEQMTGYFENKITALEQQIGQMTSTQNKGVLTSEVKDYDNVIKDVQVWVGKQPEFLQHSYQNVLDNGTVEEKLELVKAYKDTLPPEQRIDAAPAKPSQAVIDALTPVVTKRGTKPISNEVDMDDEQAAFKEATALLSKRI